MQEEIEHKTVNFAISTVKLSARTLLKGAPFFLRQYDKSASQGKQSMKRLIRQNRGVTNLEIEKTGIKDFDRYAKRYHIDYAISRFPDPDLRGDLRCSAPECCNIRGCHQLDLEHRGVYRAALLLAVQDQLCRQNSAGCPLIRR